MLAITFWVYIINLAVSYGIYYRLPLYKLNSVILFYTDYSCCSMILVDETFGRRSIAKQKVLFNSLNLVIHFITDHYSSLQ